MNKDDKIFGDNILRLSNGVVLKECRMKIQEHNVYGYCIVSLGVIRENCPNITIGDNGQYIYRVAIQDQYNGIDVVGWNTMLPYIEPELYDKYYGKLVLDLSEVNLARFIGTVSKNPYANYEIDACNNGIAPITKVLHKNCYMPCCISLESAFFGCRTLEVVEVYNVTHKLVSMNSTFADTSLNELIIDRKACNKGEIEIDIDKWKDINLNFCFSGTKFEQVIFREASDAYIDITGMYYAFIKSRVRKVKFIGINRLNGMPELFHSCKIDEVYIVNGSLDPIMILKNSIYKGIHKIIIENSYIDIQSIALFIRRVDELVLIGNIRIVNEKYLDIEDVIISVLDIRMAKNKRGLIDALKIYGLKDTLVIWGDTNICDVDIQYMVKKGKH